jgi:uncharacterized protein YggE
MNPTSTPLSFLSTAGLAQARRQALTEAVADALANAKALAAGANKDLLETIAIDSQPVYASRERMRQSANVALLAGGEDEAALVVGDLEVTCQVQVTCTF